MSFFIRDKDRYPVTRTLDAESAAAAIATPGNAVRDAIDGIVNPVADNAAMVTELTASIMMGSVTLTASFPVWVAPFSCDIKAASVVNWASGATIPASDTDYWTIELTRYRANVAAVIATKTTKVTGGEAFATRADWNFDGAAFNATNGQLAKGDIVAFVFTKTGSPTTFAAAVLLNLRYEPS